MQNITDVEIAGTVIKFFINGGGRWVFAGCRTAGGYLTLEHAQVEADAQLTGLYQGPLNPEGTQIDDWASARFYRQTLKPLQAKW